MSNNIVLTPIVFINNITATASSSWIPTDHRYSGVQHRSIFGRRDNKDSMVHVLGQVSVPQFIDGRPGAAVIATATLTSFTSASNTNFNCLIETPITAIRVIKTGVSGAGTIVGLV